MADFPWTLPMRIHYVLFKKQYTGGLAARLRAFWHYVVRGYRYEVCDECGRPVGLVWLTVNELWSQVVGSDAGIRCVGCFDAELERRGVSACWLPVSLDQADDVAKGEMVIPLAFLPVVPHE